jgi:hypothetical protein
LCSRHRCDGAIAPAARDSLWICGQRKGVAHIPTGSATSASISWIHLEGAQAQPAPVTARRSIPKAEASPRQATAPSLRGSRQPFTSSTPTQLPARSCLSPRRQSHRENR